MSQHAVSPHLSNFQISFAFARPLRKLVPLILVAALLAPTVALAGPTGINPRNSSVRRKSTPAPISQDNRGLMTLNSPAKANKSIENHDSKSLSSSLRSSSSLSNIISGYLSGAETNTIGVQNVPASTPCQLYPFVLPAQSLKGVAVGSTVNNIINGTQPGNFGWLTWSGSPSEPALLASLTPPGNSNTYTNPANSTDHEISIGDWVQGKPGLSQSTKVRAALDNLKSTDITAMLWSTARGQGNNASYLISGFVRVRLLSYELGGQNRISVRYLGSTRCPIATNRAPVVNAGPDQTINLPQTANLQGAVTDDGLPEGQALSINWSKVSGPGSVAFNAPNQATTSATFNIAGIYVLRLTASDSQLSSSDDVTITVKSANQAPQVNAGADQTITMPALANLQGTVSDDGLPTGGMLTVSWSKVGGPGTVTFSNAGNTNTTASFSAAGIYVLRLSANDSQLVTDDDVMITVNRDMTPPQISISPANGATVNTTTPLIEITYADDNSGVDKATLMVTVDGSNYTNLFTITDTKASYMASLGGGQHTIDASIKDKEGNLGQSSSRFTVSVFRALPEVTPASGTAPLTVTFITKAEYTDGAIMRYRWDFQGDGIFDTNDPGARNYTRTFTQKGTFNALLEVTNDKNQVATKTVTIVVTGSLPVATASLNPSNGAIPLLVNFTGSGTDSDGTIVKFEWDFDGDGTFDFTSATTGNTTHTYNTAGTYNAVFRVTDNDGQTSTARLTTTAIRVGPPGSPTATITAPANPLTVTAPSTVTFNGTGSDTGGTIAKYEWDFDGNGVYDYSSLTSAATSFRYESPGTFTAALRVTDNSGLTGIDTIDITVNLPVTLRVSDTCRPLQGEMASITTTQGGATPITIFIRNKAGQTVKTLVNNAQRQAGSYLDIWDCKDTGGAIVPEGTYYAILQYMASGQVKTLDLSTTTGGQFYNPSWTMSTTGGASCFTCPFKPLEDNFLKVDFTLSRASEVSVSIRLFNRVDEVVALFDRKMFGRGPYTVFWDGTDITGRIVAPPPGETFLWGMTAFTLPDNAMFVEVAPQLTNVAANPNYFDPSTGDFISPQNPTTKISYTLTKQANVSLQVFRTGTNALMRTIIQPNVAAGTGTIEWDGRDARGIFADKGDYRLAVKATDAAGNQSIVRYVLVRVFH